MRGTRSGRVITAITLFIVAASLAGCQQQELTPGEKQARLIAAENMDLKERLAGQQARIETLRQQHALELQQRDQALAKCRTRNDQLQKDIEEGIAQRVKEVTAAVVDENAKLRTQIEELRAQIEDLKAQSQPSEPSRQVP